MHTSPYAAGFAWAQSFGARTSPYSDTRQQAEWYTGYDSAISLYETVVHMYQSRFASPTDASERATRAHAHRAGVHFTREGE